MTDLALSWDAATRAGDLQVAGADLTADTGVRTAVLLSLLSDRRVPVGDLPAGETARRGWWGDSLAPDGDQIGSRLWVLGREARRPDTMRRADGYAHEALAWLVEDGVAERVDVTVTDDDGVLRIAVRVVLAPDGAAHVDVVVAGGG